MIREIEGQKRQERRIYVVKRKEIKKEIETIQEKIVSESVKECKEDGILEEEKSEEKEECKEKLEEIAQKNLGDCIPCGNQALYGASKRWSKYTDGA